MAVPYCTGPVALYVGIPSGPSDFGTPQFLGHGELAPRIKRDKKYAPIMCDLGGNLIPFDMSWQGQQAFVFVTLTRWNWNVYEVISQIVSGGGSSGVYTLGDSFGDIGTLMMTENVGFTLWLQYPYANPAAGHPAFGAAFMPLGIRFYCAFLEQEDDLEPGTQPNKQHLAFHCIRDYDPTTGALTLGDTNMSGIPLIPPN